tara:strand:- start:766 stop:1242 length:477 start_codon:yes stop_codon:yes gene_type:complete
MLQSLNLTGSIVITLTLLVGPAGAGVLLADLENALMCKCDDKCGKVLINCTCDTADLTRKSLKKQLDSGLTIEQIVKSYVDKYGETVLSAPTKSGFNLTAWITPFAALVGGGLGIRQIIRTWVRRKPDKDKVGETPASCKPENKFSRQLRKELDNLDT